MTADNSRCEVGFSFNVFILLFFSKTAAASETYIYFITLSLLIVIPKFNL